MKKDMVQLKGFEVDDALWAIFMKRLEKAKKNGTLTVESYTEIEEPDELLEGKDYLGQIKILPNKTVIFKYEEKE